MSAWAFLRSALGIVALMMWGLAEAQALVIVDQRTEAATDPLGIDTAVPRFSWRLVAERRGVVQQAFRLLVEVADGGEWRPYWDSGKLNGSQPWVDYAGQALQSRSRYRWMVTVWDEQAEMSTSSIPAFFETAWLSPDEWTAEWIGAQPREDQALPSGLLGDVLGAAVGEFCRPVLVPGPLQFTNPERLQEYLEQHQGLCRQPRPAPLLRRAFYLDSVPERARLYISGLGYMETAINGVRLGGAAVLEPGFTDYARTVLYRSYDLSERLQVGENVIGVELGSGFYDYDVVSEWGLSRTDWRADPRLIAELHLSWSDGTERVIRSDSEWRTSDGPTRYDNINLGETYDARQRREGWSSPGFDASEWAAARPVDAPAGQLRAQAHPPIAVVEELDVVDTATPVPGVTVIDMGEQLTGWARIRVDAPAGVAVALTYGESLSNTGLVGTTSNFHIADQLQTDYFIADGNGPQSWTPRFSYKGFRYLQISGPLNTPYLGEVLEVRVERVRSDLQPTASFSSSHALINQIQAMVGRAIANNLHGIVTDTPVYEKNGWTGDGQLTAPTAMLQFDMRQFHRKWLRDILDAQTEEGEIPVTVPSGTQYGYTGVGWEPAWGATPAWDAALFVIPWEAWRRYGDERLIRESYSGMRRYLLGWLPRWSSGHIVSAGLGDHLAPSENPLPLADLLLAPSPLSELVSTAYAAEFARLMATFAGLLGRENDHALFQAEHSLYVAAFQAHYADPQTGLYRQTAGDEFSQTANVIALAFDLVPGPQRATVAAAVAEDVSARGGNLATGIVGTRYILEQLAAAGYVDIAFGIATQTDFPSWGEWVELGYTALSESWGESIRSRDHHMFGSIGQWFMEGLGGIRPLEPGYQRFTVRPEIPTEGLDFVSAHYDSIHGRIASRWDRLADGFRLHVQVPPNTRAEVILPRVPEPRVTEMGTGQSLRLEQAPGVAALGQWQGRHVVEVGSGNYIFEVIGKGPEARGVDNSRGGALGQFLVCILLLLAFRKWHLWPLLWGYLGVAQAQVPGGRTCLEELVPMSDGVRLHVWVSSVDPARPQPVLLELDSYANPDHANACPEFLPSDYFGQTFDPALLQSFTLVHASQRGSGASEGLFDMIGPDTQRDLSEVIAWAREQSWSNGRIVLTGQSGSGFAAHHGLAEPGVVAAMIFTSCADPYQCLRRGGVQNTLAEVYLEGTAEGYLRSLDDRLRLRTHQTPGVPAQLGAIAGALLQTRLRPLNDEWWQERSALAQLPAAQVPVLYTTEPYDIVFPYDAYLRTPNARLVLGFGHTSAEPIAASMGRYETMVRSVADRFLAHHGLGEKNQAESDPPVLSLINAGGGVRRYRQAEAYVREEAAWPLPDTRWTDLYLDPEISGSAASLNDGSLREVPPEDGFAVAPVLAVPDPKTDLRALSYLLGASVADLRVDELRGLTYSGPVFEQGVEINGPILLRVFAAASVPDFDWAVRLADVHPDGSSHFVTDGYLRASLREVDLAQSLHTADGELLLPWQPMHRRDPPAFDAMHEYLIRIEPTAHWFAPGHHIRLDILSFAASNTDLNPPQVPGLLRLAHGAASPSHLLLPLIPTRCAEARPMRADLPPLVPCAASWSSAVTTGRSSVAPDRASANPNVAGGGASLALLLLLSGGLYRGLRGYSARVWSICPERTPPGALSVRVLAIPLRAAGRTLRPAASAG